MEFTQVLPHTVVAMGIRRTGVPSRQRVDAESVEVQHNLVEEAEQPDRLVVDFMCARKLNAEGPLLVDVRIVMARERALEEPGLRVSIACRKSARQFDANAEPILLPRPAAHDDGTFERSRPEGPVPNDAPCWFAAEQRGDVFGASHRRRSHDQAG